VSPGRLIPALLVLATVWIAACRKESDGGGPTTSKPPAEKPTRLGFEPVPFELTARFDGAKAHAHVRQLVEIGPRPSGSSGYQRALGLLEARLEQFGWTTRRQGFVGQTPVGPIPFTNLLARFEPEGDPDWQESCPAVVGGHLDSKLLEFEFVGANDGGSSTGILLELARVLATEPASAAKVELVFFDGEEAFGPNITARDGLYGSKHYARELSTRSTWPALGIVLDIVGDPDHALFHNPDTPRDFARIVGRISPAFDFEHGISPARGLIVDDHIPLQNTGMPCLHLIGDFQSMRYWHRRGDTLERVKPGMLGKVGKLTLRFLAEVERPAGGR